MFVLGVILGLISLVLLTIIYHYINGKPPGMQTVLDLLILDIILCWALFTIIVVTVLAIGVFYGNLGFHLSQILLGFLSFINHLALATVTVTLIVKGILVFKSDCLEEMSDESVQMIGRISVVIYSTILQAINSVFWALKGGVQLPLMSLLTGDDQPTVIGPGYGTLVGVLILVIMLMVFEIKRPLLDQKRMRFRTAIYTGVATGISLFLCIFGAYFELIPNEKIPLLFPCMLEFLVGIVQPCLYISGKDNLKAYALNLLTIKIVEPFRKMKIPNKVEDLPV